MPPLIRAPSGRPGQSPLPLDACRSHPHAVAMLTRLHLYDAICGIVEGFFEPRARGVLIVSRHAANVDHLNADAEIVAVFAAMIF
jgi:hypothetical protein